ncbi:MULTISPECIES: TetR/AcrR family transcriptional regulator [Streptomyces diastaticus group]|uniref:TetR/AcrR family transcriptional regulator n=1 Tax=Streptomyces diastaticus group TaxID=2849069 RepID=UPI0013BD597C|nr:TetR/AcrR family transcriptional regulator [Streptomyces sp. SID8455]WSU34348.1 TetR/AcrR family transcriptional regulator [Streptomyces gougerotii]
MSYWEHRKPVQRARAVDVDAVAHVAVELLDEGGLRALTLRAVASRLDVAPASLYSRVDSVDDLFDLALDHALGDDAVVRQALAITDLDGLMLAYYRHLVAHPWACQVIAMRAPRGPHHLRLSETICVQLIEAGDPQPLATAYALSNLAIGSATTAHAASDEHPTEVDPDLAPVYAGLHREANVSEPETTFIAGIVALRDR